MKPRLLFTGLLLTSFLLAAGAASPALAADMHDVKVALHLEPFFIKNICNDVQGEFACDATSWSSNLTTQGNLHEVYYMYIVALDIPPQSGLQGLSLGLSYNTDGGDGLETYATGLCSADHEFPSSGWPASGGGNLLWWLDCQDEIDYSDPEHQAATAAYWLYVYANADDSACITTRPQDDLLRAADCTETWWSLGVNYPVNAGCAGFGEGADWDPCYGVFSPVEETTWGAVKRKF